MTDMTSFNLLECVKKALSLDKTIVNSVAEIFTCSTDDRMSSPFITLELLSFRRNLSKRCMAEVRISLENSHRIQNLGQITGRIEEILTSRNSKTSVANVSYGNLLVRDLMKRACSKQVVFSVNFLINLN